MPIAYARAIVEAPRHKRAFQSFGCFRHNENELLVSLSVIERRCSISRVARGASANSATTDRGRDIANHRLSIGIDAKCLRAEEAASSRRHRIEHANRPPPANIHRRSKCRKARFRDEMLRLLRRYDMSKPELGFTNYIVKMALSSTYREIIHTIICESQAQPSSTRAPHHASSPSISRAKC